MLYIINDLKEYCEGCPYMILTHGESLGSGKFAYTCKYKRICERCVKKITENEEDARFATESEK